MVGNLSRPNLAGIVSICHRSLASVHDSVASLLSRDSISRRGATSSALLSITSISFRTPGIGRGGSAGALPGPYGWQSSRRGAKRDTGTRPMGWLLLSCHFRLSGRHHRYLPLFISRLLNYIPINNALPTLLGELIYHSTGKHTAREFSSSFEKPSNHHICHLDSTCLLAGRRRSVSPFRDLRTYFLRSKLHTLFI